MSKFGNLNRVQLIGRLGQDPEVRYTPSGAAVANFTVATNRSYKDKDGNWQDETDWHKIVVWNKTAEFCKEYVKKGNRVYVEGRLQTRKWTDKDGRDVYTTEVVVFDLQLLESREQQNGHTPEPEPAAVDDKDGLPF